MRRHRRHILPTLLFNLAYICIFSRFHLASTIFDIMRAERIFNTYVHGCLEWQRESEKLQSIASASMHSINIKAQHNYPKWSPTLFRVERERREKTRTQKSFVEMFKRCSSISALMAIIMYSSIFRNSFYFTKSY